MQKITYLIFAFILNDSLIAMQQVKKYNVEKTEQLKTHLGRLLRQGPMSDSDKKEAAQEINALIKAGANPNAVDNRHELLALDWAATRGFVDTVRLLLEAGADPNLQNSVCLFNVIKFNDTSDEEKESVLRLLLEAGANPSIERISQTRFYSSDPLTETPLMAAFNSRRVLCDALFFYGADPKVLPLDKKKFFLKKIK